VSISADYYTIVHRLSIRQLRFIYLLDADTRPTADRNTVYMHICERNRDAPGGDTGAIEAGGAFARHGRVLMTALGHVKVITAALSCVGWSCKFSWGYRFLQVTSSTGYFRVTAKKVKFKKKQKQKN